MPVLCDKQNNVCKYSIMPYTLDFRPSLKCKWFNTICIHKEILAVLKIMKTTDLE